MGSLKIYCMDKNDLVNRGHTLFFDSKNVTFLGSYGLTILVHTNLCGSILHFIYQTLLNISLAISWILLGKLCI